MAFIKLTQLSIPKSIALRLGTFVSAKKQRAVPLSDKLAFVRQRCSPCEAGVAPQSRPFFKPYMDTNRKLTNRNVRKPETASYKYSFRLNEVQNIRFNELLCKAGLEHNRSRFIVKRLFGEEFVVVRRNPSKMQFVARQNDLYFQFQKLANNYNQVVRSSMSTSPTLQSRIKSPCWNNAHAS